MKKNLQFLFSLVALMCVALTANAQFADGKYYLQNVESGKYWGAANDWGTRASLIKNPDYVTLIANEDGTYNLESQVSNGGTNYYFGGDYMDGAPVAGGLTITASGDYYTIANGDNYFGYDGSSAILGKNLAADSKNALWNIIPEADMVASLAKATADAPVDATFLIIDHTFGRNNRNVGAWNNTGGAALTGGNSNKHCAEKYHGVFDVNQVLANAPKGVYKFTAQGFYRQDGEDNDNLPVFYINDVTTTIPVKTGSENSMADACASFEKGLYAAEPLFIELEEAGDLTVGVKLAENANLWVIWDNFELTYYGPDADVAKIQLADYVAQVEALRAKAEELKDKNISSVTKEAIEAALTASAEIEATKEAYNTAIAALTAANNKAEADIKDWAAIEALSNLAENTNVYTADAFKTFDDARTAYKTAWEEGTLTEAVVNPEVVAGWHSANTFDDLLLSAWTIGGAQCKDFDTALYINTWSVEGDTDGTNFRVPFFEYWTGDANSLGANELTATLTEIPAGDYVVTAWVRARAKNGVAAADATGITLSANGGEAVDVTEGEGVGQFNIGEYKANATVGTDGKLTITFNVAADNNISWLSFKNVKYQTPEAAAAEELQKNYEKAMAEITEGNYYQIYTEQGEAKYYLTTEGKLTADEAEAGDFLFKTALQTGAPYAKGWNLGYQFTNPNMDGGGNGTVKNEGYIRSDSKNDRNDYERQVFFYNGKEYAVRATNATGTSWGADTYWTVLESETEIPNAGYSISGQPNYIWKLNDVTTEVILASAQDLLAEAKAVVEAKEGVGTALFQITEEAYSTYAAAVDAADKAINAEDATEESIIAAVNALNAANEAYANAARVAPKAGQAYIVANATATGNLSVATESVTVSTDAEVYFTAVEGGFAISNEAGEYIFKTTNNTWTLSTTTDIASAYVLKVNAVEGGFTLQGANGLLGTDTTEDGATVYANKAQSNNGLWTITEVKPELVYVDLTKEMFHDWSAADGTAEVTLEAAYCDYSIGTGEVGAGTTVYGNGNVLGQSFADLSAYKTLVLTVKSGGPRILLNTVGQVDPKQFIELNATAEKPYFTIEGETWTVDLDGLKETEGVEYVHLNTIKIGWGGAGEVADAKLGKIKEPEIAIDIERYPGLGYAVTDATVDFAAAKKYLGVEEITTDMLRIVNPDGTEISDYATYDGWFNGEGVAETWGDNTKINVKFFQAIPDGAFTICDMNGADEVGSTYTVKWALEANGKKVTYVINVNFVEKPVIALTFDDLNKLEETSVAFKSEVGNAYEGMTSDVDVAAILTKLGVESIDDVTIYAVQSDGSLDDNYKLGTTDGWRDAASDWKAWNPDLDQAPYFYVKADFSKADTQLYEVGGYPGHTDEAATYTATYAFVKTGSADAVVLKVTLTYTDPSSVGNEDNTSGWWTAFSNFYEINKGQIATISFDNFNAGDGANWNNWLLIAQKQGIQINGAGDDEYFALRNDNYGWGGKYDGNSLKNNFNWDNFIADMNGSHVDMILGMDADGKIIMSSVITTAEGTAYNYSYASQAVADVEGFEFFFTVELSHIKNLEVNIADGDITEAVGISRINATSTLKNGKYLENNKVVIIRNGVKYSVNGAVIK